MPGLSKVRDAQPCQHQLSLVAWRAWRSAHPDLPDLLRVPSNSLLYTRSCDIDISKPVVYCNIASQSSEPFVGTAWTFGPHSSNMAQTLMDVFYSLTNCVFCFPGTPQLKINSRSFRMLRLLGEVRMAATPSPSADCDRADSRMSTSFRTPATQHYTP